MRLWTTSIPFSRERWADYFHANGLCVFFSHGPATAENGRDRQNWYLHGIVAAKVDCKLL
ncbi:MAG: hypothetical protein KDK23_15910 [Leptospiraceae bacterium]|nr:hypothetical protein [Leptospiraceae bacterium]